MTRPHAVLSASAAHRWLICTPSARMEEKIETDPSPYAEEGTEAHAKAEEALKRYLETGQAPNVDDEDVQTYVDYVIERIQTYPNPLTFIEQTVHFHLYAPEGFGTADCIIVADGTLEVIDLKYGKGVKVEAKGNAQLRLYALGALEMYSILYPIERVRMTIVQPRLDHIETEELLADELRRWGDEYVRPRAMMAYKGEGNFVPGDHCRFCRVRATCRARAEHLLDLARHEFAPPETLTDEELGEVIAKAEQIAAWVEDVKAYAVGRILSGQKIPGWKVVEGRSQRKIADEAAAIETLRAAGFGEVTKVVIKPLGELEKLVGRKRLPEILGPLLVRPPGKPTLAPEDDPRPDYVAMQFESIEEDV